MNEQSHLFSIDTTDLTALNSKKNVFTELLEKGNVLFLPHLSFSVLPSEMTFLSPHCADKKTKNVSFNPLKGTLKGTVLKGDEALALQGMLARFADFATAWATQILAYPRESLEIGRTSFRPVEIEGRRYSYRKDDTRLHVDAFASTPLQGKRILRVFSNINPNSAPRVWHLGESFAEVVDRFGAQARPMLPLESILLKQLKLTKSLRSHYDHLMLQIHDNMKKDEAYQKAVTKERVAFPANSSWIVYTDLVSHAALAGQYVLEQTFYLTQDDMHHPEASPLRQLEMRLSSVKSAKNLAKAFKILAHFSKDFFHEGRQDEQPQEREF